MTVAYSTTRAVDVGHLKPRCEGLGPLDAGFFVFSLRALAAARWAVLALDEVGRAVDRRGLIGKGVV